MSAEQASPEKMKMNAADIFTAAADLLDRPGAWTRGFTARRPDENPKVPGDMACLATDKRANQWGALGAIFKVGHERGLRNNDCYSLGRRVAQHLGVSHLTDWAADRDRTQAEVVSAFREAAVAARGSQ